MKKSVLLLGIFVAILCGCGVVEKPIEYSRAVGHERDLVTNEMIVKDKKKIPAEYLLKVPFIMQAPFANWSEHNESCEEAGLLLVNYYYQNKILTKEIADQEIKEMVSFQKQNYGGEFDIYAKEMAKLATDFYGYNNPLVFEGSKENIIKEILNNNPVIVPTTAAYLKPEKSDYPEMGYHVVVIVGYDETGYITHDPGTYSGENTHYSFGVMEKAMSDYNKQVLVLK